MPDATVRQETWSALCRPGTPGLAERSQFLAGVSALAEQSQFALPNKPNRPGHENRPKRSRLARASKSVRTKPIGAGGEFFLNSLLNSLLAGNLPCPRRQR